MNKAVYNNSQNWPTILSNLNTQRNPGHPGNGVLSSGDIRFENNSLLSSRVPKLAPMAGLASPGRQRPRILNFVTSDQNSQQKSLDNFVIGYGGDSSIENSIR